MKRKSFPGESVEQWLSSALSIQDLRKFSLQIIPSLNFCRLPYNERTNRLRVYRGLLTSCLRGKAAELRLEGQ